MKLIDFPYADAAKVFGDAWAEGWALPPDLNVSEWADQNRYLSTKAAGESGRWRTSRTPYLREIMDALSINSTYERVVFQAGAQVGKTEAGNNWVGYVIDVDPGPMMIVQTTSNTAKRFSKQRIKPLLQETPCLAKKVLQNKGGDDANTTLMKDFANGFLVICGANSAADLRSMPVGKLFLDEVDSYPEDLDEEGDPVELAIARTATFSSRKIFICSTPTLKGHSRIDSEYEASDQRRYMVPCPHCKEHQWLKFANLKFDKADTSNVHYACEHCGVLIEEHHKTWMLENGYWEAQATSQSGVAGFHLSSLYSPAGWVSWSKIADRFLAAIKRSSLGDFSLLKSFVNTVLGESFDAEQDKVKSSEVKRLCADFRLRTIPVGCLLLTAGVDTQDNRLEVQVLGWGRGEKPTVVDYLVIYGDTSTPEPWSELDKYLDTPFTNSFGFPMRIERTAVDAGGHRSHLVYGYARTRKHKGIFAIRGASQADRPIISGNKKLDHNAKGKVLAGGAEFWWVGTDTAKSLLMGKIKSSLEKLDTPAEWNIAFSSDLEDEYFKQLTAESYDPTKRRWIKPHGRRNEALDTFVYAMAAAMHPNLRAHKFGEHDWLKRQELFEPKIRDLFGSEPEQEGETLPVRQSPAASSPAPAKQISDARIDASSDDWLDGRSVDY